MKVKNHLTPSLTLSCPAPPPSHRTTVWQVLELANSVPASGPWHLLPFCLKCSAPDLHMTSFFNHSGYNSNISYFTPQKRCLWTPNLKTSLDSCPLPAPGWDTLAVTLSFHTFYCLCTHTTFVIISFMLSYMFSKNITSMRACHICFSFWGTLYLVHGWCSINLC